MFVCLFVCLFVCAEVCLHPDKKDFMVGIFNEHPVLTTAGTTDTYPHKDTNIYNSEVFVFFVCCLFFCD